MLKKKLSPPYVPVLKDEADTAHFDLEEVKVNIDLTLEEQTSNQTAKIDYQHNDFDGFTFDGGEGTVLGTSLENNSLR